MKKVLITGVTGFIGNNLVRALHGKKGIFFVGHSRNIESAKKQMSGMDIDFIDEISLKNIDKHGIDTIIHLAGIAHDLSGKYQAEDYYKVNYQNTVQLFEIFAHSAARSFVFVSSVKAVTDHPEEQITEQTPAAPTSAYGRSKQQAEEYIYSHKPQDKKAFVLRPGMVHGYGNKGNLNLLYKLIKAGIPYPLGAFDNQRSFLSINNFVFVIEKIIEGHLTEGTYMLADSERLSTVELVRLIASEIQKRPKIWKVPKFIITWLAAFGSLVHAPFNKQTLNKLTGNMVISNKKLLLNLGENLPVEVREGIKMTIRSMHG